MVVEDIVDTGRTMRKLLKTLEIFRPKTVKVRIDFFCTFIRKVFLMT